MKKSNAVPATKKKVVVIGDMELGNRRAFRFSEEQERVYRRAVTMLEHDKPPGLALVIVVPVMGPHAALAQHFFNHFNAILTECESLCLCHCQSGVEEACDCLRDHLTEESVGRLLLIPPKDSARMVTDALMNRLRRPKKDLVNLEGLVGHPLFFF